VSVPSQTSQTRYLNRCGIPDYTHKGPDNDWKKLVQMMRYLRGTTLIPLILRADSVPIPKWWVDGSHATHPNMLGHTCGCISLGDGMPINTSTKQKINTQSSPENSTHCCQ
jgi:hypothetical protein